MSTLDEIWSKAAPYLVGLVPEAVKLGVAALRAIAAGDEAKAARKAQEAARRQRVKLELDAELAAKKAARRAAGK